MQANDGVHLGVDNLGVVCHVGRLLDGRGTSRLVKDGDLILLIERMLCLRGLDTVRISKVKGHADEALVRAGCVRDLDRLGNNGADEAAAFGRRREPWWVTDARRNCSGVCARWRLLSACIGFLLPLPGLLSIMMVWLVLLWILWFGLRVVPRRGVALFMLFVIELWPYSVSMLVKWVAFLYSLHWPQGGADLGVGGVSYVELLILYELWACERLSLEKAHPRYLRLGAPISVSAVPFGPGIDPVVLLVLW